VDAGNLFPTGKSIHRAAWDDIKRDQKQEYLQSNLPMLRALCHRFCLLDDELFIVKVYLLAVVQTTAQPENKMLGQEDIGIQYTKIALT